MKRLAALFVVGLALTFTWSGPAQAQEEAAGTAAEIILVKPLTGHTSQFEEGVKRHYEWALGQGAEWSWFAFYISMGERTGTYMFGSFDHTYADFDQGDADPQANAESIERNIVPHVGDVVVSMLRFRPDLSIVNLDAPVRSLYQVYTAELKPGGNDDYEHLLKKIRDALTSLGVTEAEYQVYEYMLGGTPGTWIISFPYESFAAMEPAASEEGDPLFALLEGAYGEFEAQALMDGVDKIIASHMIELFVFRPDLSMNVPEPGGN